MDKEKIVLRRTKQAPLSAEELDDNFECLANAVEKLTNQIIELQQASNKQTTNAEHVQSFGGMGLQVITDLSELQSDQLVCFRSNENEPDQLIRKNHENRILQITEEVMNA